MDYPDFAALARSYGYNELQFLIALRRAGLTSLAVPEELGSGINLSTGAVLIPGQTLIDTARTTPISDPTLAGLARAGAMSPADLYLLVYTAADLARYRAMIPLHLGRHALRVIRVAAPTILAIRSQIDFFSSLGFGIPAGPLALTRDAHLLLVPRLQNDERFGASQIDALMRSFLPHERVSTVIFFGLRNEVLGYPDHLDDTAAAFKAGEFNFGAIETYDQTQLQKGNEGLAERIPAQTVRVQAISKTEQDKLDLRTIVARYLFGVRERNIRVVYLRPYLHVEGDLTPEGTNVEMVRELADGLRAQGFRLGRATPFRAFGANPLEIVIVSLAVPATLLLLLEALGARPSALVVLGVRRPTSRSCSAAIWSITICSAASSSRSPARSCSRSPAVVAIARAFTAPDGRATRAALRAGLRTLGVAAGLRPLRRARGRRTAERAADDDRDRTLQRRQGRARPAAADRRPRSTCTRRCSAARRSACAESARRRSASTSSPPPSCCSGSRCVYVPRSGNQSDIAPSTFELSLRSD